MNLIEQAAKRLAELQRAGAETTPDVPASASALERAQAAPVTRTPTPEALVREINAGRVGQTLVGGATAAPAEPAVASPPSVPEFIPRHGVEFDFARLKQLGVVTPDSLESWTAHELRILKRPILLGAKGQTSKPIVNANRVMVTSALPGEGKTFTAANLALSIAMEFEDSVLLVDGDVAHPSLLQLLGVPQTPGLLDLLTRQDVALEDVVLKTNLDRLLLLPAGTRHHRATELIASDRMNQLMDTLSARLPGRIIIFDSPPLIPTTESRVLATHAGQVIMVVAADSTSRQAVEEALATIERCECVMMVLNKAVSSSAGSYYGYYAGAAPG